MSGHHRGTIGPQLKLFGYWGITEMSHNRNLTIEVNSKIFANVTAILNAAQE